MRATILHGPGDIRVEHIPDPEITEDTDAIVRMVASCVCGSDLWPYRGIDEGREVPHQIGHEFVGVVEQVGSDVSQVSIGDFVIAPFLYSCGTCAHCRNGVHTSCVSGGGYAGCQAELVRVPQADGTLVTVPGEPSEDMLSHLLALSDVFPTGHHAALVAGVTAGSTVAVVGDGAVGLSAVWAAKRLGAAKVVSMSRYPERAAIARAFGADDVIAERGKEGAAAVVEYFDGIGASAVLECVGTNDSMKQAFLSLRPGGRVGFVGIPHGVELNPRIMFYKNTGLAGGVAPARAYLDELVPEVLDGRLRPGAVFDATMPLDQVADAYRAMDERIATKVMLRP